MKISHLCVLCLAFLFQNAMAFQITYAGPAKGIPKPPVAVAPASAASDVSPEPAADPNLLFSNKEEPEGEIIKGKCSNGDVFIISQTGKIWQALKPRVASSDENMAPADFAKNIACSERL